MKHIPIILILVVLVGLSCGWVSPLTPHFPQATPPPATAVPASPQPLPPVPIQFQPLADELNAEMGTFEASLTSVENGSLGSLGQWLQGFLHTRMGP